MLDDDDDADDDDVDDDDVVAVASPLSDVSCSMDHVGSCRGESGTSHQGEVAAGKGSPV